MSLSLSFFGANKLRGFVPSKELLSFTQSRLRVAVAELSHGVALCTLSNLHSPSGGKRKLFNTKSLPITYRAHLHAPSFADMTPNEIMCIGKQSHSLNNQICHNPRSHYHAWNFDTRKCVFAFAEKGQIESVEANMLNPRHVVFTFQLTLCILFASSPATNKEL